MLWLDSIYPPEKEGQPGGARGPCSQDSGVPSEVEAEHPNAYVSSPAPRVLALPGSYVSLTPSTARSSGPTSGSAPSARPTTCKLVPGPRFRLSHPARSMPSSECLLRAKLVSCSLLLLPIPDACIVSSDSRRINSLDIPERCHGLGNVAQNFSLDITSFAAVVHW